MPTFELTAKHSVNRPGGFFISKGQEMTITIPMMGIGPNNLFGNNRCKEALVRQFQINGLYVPPTDTGIYSRGMWDIKIK